MSLEDLLNQLNNLVVDENKIKMSEPLKLHIDPLKYLSKVPEFTGDYRDLQSFCNLIDRIHPILIKYDELSQNIFSDVIKSKLRGKAREIIEINNHVTAWLEIKDTLINNFGERKSLEELFDELRGVQYKSNPIEFFNDIKIALRRLNNKTKLILNDDLANSEQTIENNKNTALALFKSKIPEPMHSILYCRNPDTLEDAMNILYESGYANYSSHNKNNSNRPQNRQTNNNNYNNNQHNRNGQNYNKQSENKNIPRNNEQNFQRQPNFQRQNPNSNPNQLNYNNPNPRPPFNPFKFNNPYFNRNNQNNYGNNNNSSNQNFWTNRNNGNNPLPPPEPMDINMQQTNERETENFPLQASTTTYPIS
jgi:hypothetical protein